MTTTEFLRHSSPVTQMLGRLFRKLWQTDNTREPRKNTLSPANRYEGGYDETKPFFMQENWRR